MRVLPRPVVLLDRPVPREAGRRGNGRPPGRLRTVRPQVGGVDGYEHHRWVDSLAAFESATRRTFAALVDATASSAGVSWQPIPDVEPGD